MALASQRVRPGRRQARADAVYEVIDQLAGAAIPASALETLVLPGRVPGYSPALLDELTAAGEIVWSGAGALPGSDGWIILAPAAAAPLLLPEPADITTTPVHQAVLGALEGGGALFFRTHRRSGRRPPSPIQEPAGPSRLSDRDVASRDLGPGLGRPADQRHAGAAAHGAGRRAPGCG